MIKVSKLESREQEAVQFDGSFESAINLVNWVKARTGFEKVGRFDIAYPADHRCQLSFTLTQNVNDPKRGVGKSDPSIVLNKGDWLILAGDSYERFSGAFVEKYFKKFFGGVVEE